MGLTKNSVGRGAVDGGESVTRHDASERIIALAGNPNVGKSTVFNALTGMNQHTGNWPGKTVAVAEGVCRQGKTVLRLVDLPGTYSLLAHSAEEEVARNFLLFGGHDAAAVVCDATCLERNMNLVLQVLEIAPRTVVCVNLLDEARRKGISFDFALLSARLGVPVVGVTARRKRSLGGLLAAVEEVVEREQIPYRVPYPAVLEEAAEPVIRRLEEMRVYHPNPRWLAMRLLEEDEGLCRELNARPGFEVLSDGALCAAVDRGRQALFAAGVDTEHIKDMTVGALVGEAERICQGAVHSEREGYGGRDRRWDRFLTGRVSAYPAMLLLLALVFWLTVSAANYPSALLSRGLFYLGDRLRDLLQLCHAPGWLCGALVDGVWRVLAWVVSVMLPPMAIFFPLFTLLEDAGYLPRVAYNLDRPFRCAGACGKQALTMCMGFGCNAAGVVGCRIIDSRRERLLAILTNNFVPCNGRFPTMVVLITLFFVGGLAGFSAGIASAGILVGFVVLSVAVTFFVTKLLSKTLLRGEPSSFTLELPPYRRPQIGRVLVRSVFDRTLFVLGRAAAVAAPAGLFIWILANIPVGESNLLVTLAGALDPLGRFLGMDGAILLAFFLGFPANEIVLPITLMIYTAGGSLVEYESVAVLGEMLRANGWNAVTAVCAILFSLFHFPCSTTLITVRRESGSIGWTVAAALIPTAVGCLLCAAVSLLFG